MYQTKPMVIIVNQVNDSINIPFIRPVALITHRHRIVYLYHFLDYYNHSTYIHTNYGPQSADTMLYIIILYILTKEHSVKCLQVIPTLHEQSSLVANQGVLVTSQLTNVIHDKYVTTLNMT